MGRGGLFSAYAEVFLSDNLHVERGVTFLCLRRGVSDELRRHAGYDDFSLPTQRCFSRMFLSITLARLFSAYAEVFLAMSIEIEDLIAFLCLRRGVSKSFRQGQGKKELFSAYAEVFPLSMIRPPQARSFLCLRRGVSRVRLGRTAFLHFSLPTQRCFRHRVDLVGFL